jgi:hypothetical protein
VKLKFWLTPIFLLAFLSWIPIGSMPSLDGAVNIHSFLSSENFHLNVPGIEAKNLDRIFSQAFLVPHFLKDLGYRLKIHLGQGYTWFFPAKSKYDDTHLHLILRDDVADEFEGEHSAKIYENRLRGFFKKFREIETSKGSPVMLIIIPNKIFANKVLTEFKDGEAEAKKMMRINGISPNIRSETAQRKYEELIRSWGQTTISLIDFYKNIQSYGQISPLHPYGESHWSRDLIYEVGPEIVRQMMDALKLTKACYVQAAPTKPNAAREDYFGDIFEGYGPDINTALGDMYKTSMMAYSPSNYVAPPQRDACPIIYYVGTSYGKFLEGRGGIVESMQRAYRNKIVNFSLSGRGAHEPMDQLTTKSLLSKSIILVEFPFRLLKE